MFLFPDAYNPDKEEAAYDPEGEGSQLNKRKREPKELTSTEFAPKKKRLTKFKASTPENEEEEVPYEPMEEEKPKVDDDGGENFAE